VDTRQKSIFDKNDKNDKNDAGFFLPFFFAFFLWK
tara:strand:- start:187 stop:291 length:105 start_codon:yes stop_codon:yes gene_type:complete